MKEVLWQIRAPHFTAALVTRLNRVAESAPIIRWSLGVTTKDLAQRCRRKGWQMRPVL